jgi:hypothetical protein
MGYFIWIVTIAISFLVVRFSIKMDYNKNEGWIMDDLEDLWGVMILLFVALFIPIINICVAVIFLVTIAINTVARKHVNAKERIIKKIFLIKS